MGDSRSISQILDEIVSEIILIDPGDADELKHLRELINELESDVPSETVQELKSFLNQLANPAEQDSSMQDAIKSFQENVELLFKKYTEGDGSMAESEAPEDNVEEESPVYLDDPELLEDFLVEAEEHLQSAEKNLIEVEEDPENRQLIDSIFRPFHTIKGIAGFLGIDDIQTLAHEYENYLDVARAGKTFITTSATNCILQAIDGMREIMAALDESLAQGKAVPHNVDVDNLVAMINNVGNENSSEQSPAAPEEQKPETAQVSEEPAEEKVSAQSHDPEEVPITQPEENPEEESPTPEPPPATEQSIQQQESTEESSPDEVSLDDIQEALEEPDELEALMDPELLQDFLTESGEYLEGVEGDLIKWERDPENLQLVDDIFRPFHTIKGVAGFLNLIQIQTLAHEYENVLDQARNGKIKLTREITDLILAGIDAFRTIFNSLASSLENNSYVKHGIDIAPYIKKLRLLQAGKSLQTGTPETVPKETPESTVEKDSEPALAPAENKKEDSLAEEKPVPEQTEKVQESQPKPTENQAKKEEPPKSAAAKPTPRKKASSVIKVDTDKMDHLIDMVGELVITQNMVAQNKVILESSNKRLLGDVAQLKRITSTLQNISMSLRMVPIEATFLKMQRIVRDLSHKSGKKIQLKLLGEQTEIDRNMVEAIYDPLVHMVRNSCDHGVESPDKRREKGKDEQGTIQLNAYHKGGNVVIEIKDDGAGLDKDVILKKAMEKGVIEDGKDLSDRQIYDLLFAPGFSTAKQVTEVSGRGVGMDVVKRTIEKLRGQIDIESELGEGTTFYIKLPLTLAIIDGVIVKVGSERYVIPTLNIEESVQPTESSYNYVAGRGETIMVREHIFPLIRIHDLFSVKGAVEKPWEGIVMLVDIGGSKAGILVDELVDKQEIVIKSMGEQFQSLPGISGGAILGDGTVGLILDIPNLMQVRDAKRNEERERIIAERYGGQTQSVIPGQA